ncbi:hypothetical protein [Marinobacterium lutimaris]|uniref:Uncharacterized protein n=1 Tax=Marinobacterium lutimaris TaxID=568106 RepID=A0A1H5XVS4_9GAMM|nr:hypothetical protein [Marinobacterium lutimaris]SEG15899.1 hypothetical protein SAMN05444390_1011524 [Marinobacterium lutimaris]
MRTTDVNLTERHLQQIEHAMQNARAALQINGTTAQQANEAVTELNAALRLLEIPECPLLPAPAAA